MKQKIRNVIFETGLDLFFDTLLEINNNNAIFELKSKFKKWDDLDPEIARDRVIAVDTTKAVKNRADRAGHTRGHAQEVQSATAEMGVTDTSAIATVIAIDTDAIVDDQVPKIPPVPVLHVKKSAVFH